MEVDNARFWRELPSILDAIANAKFVAIDIEMSGITTSHLHGSTDRSHDSGKPNLQQFYQEAKEAAERYQILQIGITPVTEDRERGMMIAKPYNFYLNPSFPQGEKLNMARDIVLSSKSVEFLIKAGFDLAAIFTKGVPYLSRHDETIARKAFAENQDWKEKIADMSIDPNNTETLEFYNKIKRDILQWVSQEKKSSTFVAVGGLGDLSNYQIRLIHQVVHKEFPGYRAYKVRNGQSMQVEKIDEQREASIAQSNLARFEESIGQQLGWRILFDALAGHLIDVNPKWLCTPDKDDPLVQDVEYMRWKMANLRKSLTHKRPILVGHNIITDLIFIYSTFVGPLPEKVSDFTREIHTRFPLVIDTKYLATHDAGRWSSSLREVYDKSKLQFMPLISLDDPHFSYNQRQVDHEAGYDSWMTAVVFTKLSSKLAAKIEAKESVAGQRPRIVSKWQDTEADLSVESTTAAASRQPWKPTLSWRTSSEKSTQGPSFMPKTDKAEEMMRREVEKLKENIMKKKGSPTAKIADPPAMKECTSTAAHKTKPPKVKETEPPVLKQPGPVPKNVTPSQEKPTVQTLFSSFNSFATLEDQGNEGDISSELSSDSDMIGPVKGGVLLPRPNTPTNQTSLLDTDIDSPFKRAEHSRPHILPLTESNWRSPNKGQVTSHAAAWEAPGIRREKQHKPSVRAAVPKTSGVPIGRWIPDMDSDFWKIYGNKLRVYATEDELCDLNA